MTGVYILYEKDYQLYKVGFTENLKTRLHSFKPYYKFDLSQSLFFVIDNKFLKTLEKTLHLILSPYQANHPHKKNGYTEFYLVNPITVDLVETFVKNYEKDRFLVYSLSNF